MSTARITALKGRMSTEKVREALELATTLQVREYARTCKNVCAAAMMYAVLNENGQHMQDSTGRLMYSIGDGAMTGTIGVTKEALTELGYSDDTGWPCALLMGAKAPVYAADIDNDAIKAGVVVEEIADIEQTRQRIADTGNGKVGSEAPVKDFTPVVECETEGTHKQRTQKPRCVDKTMSPTRQPVAMHDAPAAPYTAESVEGKKRITDYAMDLAHLGVPREVATVTATAILRQMRIVA